MDGSVPIAPVAPWHEGERALQQSAGSAQEMAVIGRRVIRDHLIEQHRAFYPQLPFVVAGTVDPAGNAWATILAGNPGFLASPDPGRLRITTLRDPSDPADAGLEHGDAVGLLGIELHTRRRNRMNGAVRRLGDTVFDVVVAESYGNCPQYIQVRDFAMVRDPGQRAGVARETNSGIDEQARAMIARADTFFIASYVDREETGRQVDVSHRGGRPGFVHVDERGVLTIPDFAGNRFFNTLGNILVNPRSGLAFVDFESGDMLQLTGTGEVVLKGPEVAAFQGAERLLRFTPHLVVRRRAALPLRWTARRDGASPNALLTGSWEEASARLSAARNAANWRQFRIAGITAESVSIRSLYLEPMDGAGLPPYQAGQHLPVRFALPGQERPVVRTYTLSSAPSDGVYRISVKRLGVASQWLHGLQVGDIIEARSPAGAFTIDAHAKRPAVLLAAGVGITPLLAMLRHVVYESLRTRSARPVWLFQAAHSKAERAFGKEIAALEHAANGQIRVIRVLSDVSGAVADVDYHAVGHIDLQLISSILPFDDYDFYLCGPGSFMQDVYDGLRDLDIADTSIHTESFGPAALKRRAGEGGIRVPGALAQPVSVSFVASDRRVQWTAASGSLLELAEASGLAPPFSCRQGSCGSCRTRIIAGGVSYSIQPSAEFAENEALLCCSVPAEGTTELRLDL